MDNNKNSGEELLEKGASAAKKLFASAYGKGIKSLRQRLKAKHAENLRQKEFIKDFNKNSAAYEDIDGQADPDWASGDAASSVDDADGRHPGTVEGGTTPGTESVDVAGAKQSVNVSNSFSGGKSVDGIPTARQKVDATDLGRIDTARSKGRYKRKTIEHSKVKKSVDNTFDHIPMDKSADVYSLDTADSVNKFKVDMTHDNVPNNLVDSMDFDDAVSVDPEMVRTPHKPFSGQLDMIDDFGIGKKKKDSGIQAGNGQRSPSAVSMDRPITKVGVERYKQGLPSQYGKVNHNPVRMSPRRALSAKDRRFKLMQKFRMSGGGGGSSTSKIGGNIGKAIIKVIREILKKEVIKAAATFLFPLILIIFLIVAVATILSGILAPVSAVNLAAYPADEEDITESTLDATTYCEDLKEYIESIPELPEWSHIDEFRYIPSLEAILEEIDYDAWELQAYLNAKFEKFDAADVAAEIQSIMEEMFVLKLEEIIEIRQRETEDGGVEDYEYYILEISLEKTELEEIIMARMDEDQKEKYDVFMDIELLGVQQGVSNPFDIDWRPYVTCRFGWRDIESYETGEMTKDNHTGMDISWGGCHGTPLHAGVTGKVTSITSNGPYGNKVDITSSDGTIVVRYAHLSAFSVSVGDVVKAGFSEIGKLGSTGWSTGPHLHIEVHKDGELLDPQFFVGYGKKGESDDGE